MASINVDDFNDTISRLKHDLEKKDNQLKQAARIEEDINRQLKTAREDNAHLDETVKNQNMQLSTLQASESETKQSLKVCEQALNEIKAEKVSLTWKLNVEEKRATRLEETLRRAALTKGVNLPNQVYICIFFHVWLLCVTLNYKILNCKRRHLNPLGHLPRSRLLWDLDFLSGETVLDRRQKVAIVLVSIRKTIIVRSI